MRKVVFLDRATFPDAVTVRAPSFAHEWSNFARTAPDETLNRIRDAHIVITNKVPLGREILSQCNSLEMIAVAATGTNIVDLECCRERGVTVSNIRDYATATVPEHSFALLLALTRSIRPYHDSVADGRWGESGQFCYFDYPIMDLRGKVIGIIGAGALGTAVARIAEGFGMTVLFAGRRGQAPRPGQTDFETFLATSDVITVHCPLTPETENLIGKPEFDAMKKRPIVINTARGGIVDEAALVEALRDGRIAGAGFDVVTKEPIPDDHPFMDLMGLPNFILTPHVAWASIEAIQSLSDQLVDNIEASVAGAPRNVVT